MVCSCSFCVNLEVIEIITYEDDFHSRGGTTPGILQKTVPWLPQPTNKTFITSQLELSDGPSFSMGMCS